MNIDEIKDIEILKNLLKKVMAKLLIDIKTPDKILKAGEWFFISQDEDGVFLYLDNPCFGVMLTYEEANEWLEY